VTPAFVDIWHTIIHRVWAQWRFENDLPHQRPPRVVDAVDAGACAPVAVRPGPVEMLSFCGGGKDSLVAARLLERAGASFDSFVYTSSIYGDHDAQQLLVDGLLAHLPSSSVRRMAIDDDFMTSDVLASGAAPGVRTLTAAETPSSIFEALPLVLAHGYRHLVLGHERSANVGNLVWNVTGEDVNHQWGKPSSCEALLRAYVRRHLVVGFDVFSVLGPVHDVVIFSLLAEAPMEAIRATHSCNVAKPWCRRCPKCVYVWLGYLAHLDEEAVAGWFGEDLFAVEANREHLAMMAGLGVHTPFECIGQVDETRLALELCRAKGMRGPLLDAVPKMAPADIRAAAAAFTAVDEEYDALPSSIRDAVLAAQRTAGRRATVALEALTH
jgi:hypothetical protein